MSSFEPERRRDGERIQRAVGVANKLLDNIDLVVRGKQEEIRLVLTALLCRGHVLLEDVPGTAKTVLARALAQSIEGAAPSRIQCTPDLQPTDVTGLSVYNQRERDFEFRPGPIFANVVLVDEINRAMPKTQSSLLEAMAETQVTVDGVTRELPQPFLVLATQNPIELEGTYPLPEAQLDRFMFNIVIDYLPEEEEMDVVRKTTAIQDVKFTPVVTGAEIVALQRLVRRVPVADEVVRYAVGLARRSRPKAEGSPEFVRKWVEYGASVRAAQYLVLGGKARALMRGRSHVSFDDIRALAHPVFRHRILRNFHAESERVDSGQIVDQLLEAVPVPRSRM